MDWVFCVKGVISAYLLCTDKSPVHRLINELQGDDQQERKVTVKIYLHIRCQLWEFKKEGILKTNCMETSKSPNLIIYDNQINPAYGTSVQLSY